MIYQIWYKLGNKKQEIILKQQYIFVYQRKEFNNHKESNSITNQRPIIDNYLNEHKEYKLVDYYIDDGHLGANFDKPKFQRMLEDNKIDVILIKYLSRFGRNYIKTGIFLEGVFPVMRVSIILINENFEINYSDYYGDISLKNYFLFYRYFSTCTKI